MRSRAQIGGELFAVLDGFESGWRAPIAELANQSVNGSVLAKLLHSRRKDDEFRAICKGHAGSVDGFVAQPGAPEFAWVQIDHSFSNRRVEHDEVHAESKLRRLMKALNVIADE